MAIAAIRNEIQALVPGATRERTHLPGEAEVIERAIADPRAFSPLYEHYVDDVYGYCYRRVSDPELAADLTSNIFIRVLQALPRFDIRGKTSFRSWLFTIAHNSVVDNHRTHKDQKSLDNEERQIDVHDPAPSPEDCAMVSDLRADIITALAELTDQQRQIVELRLVGLSGPEIASVLGLNVAAVKSAQFRAYTRLRTLLRDRFEIEFGSH